MRLQSLRRQDTWAGLLFLAIGAAALWIAQSYPPGSATQMGPGYFPRLLGGVLSVLGVIIAARGLLADGEVVAGLKLRPFLILGAVIAFAVLMVSAGLVFAIGALIIIGAAASHEFRLKETLVAAVALILFSVAVFNWGLGLHMPLWPEW